MNELLLSLYRQRCAGMDLELKDALAATIRDVIEKWKDRGGTEAAIPKRPSKYEKRPRFGAETSILGTKNVPPGMADAVRRKLLKSRKWRRIEDALAMAALVELLEKEIAREGRAAIDLAQMTLPGFEHLPKRLGPVAIADASVKRLFAFKAKYEKRSERDSRTLEQLRELTKRLHTFNLTNPELTVAEALRRLDQPKGLAIVAERGAAE